MIRLTHLIDKASEQQGNNKTDRWRDKNRQRPICCEHQLHCVRRGSKESLFCIWKLQCSCFESLREIRTGLEDIISEAKDLEVLTIRDKVYSIQFFLGGELKFLASVCGIGAANSEHACIWCKCPKQKRWNMALNWSIQNRSQGARTVEEIKEKCKLGKSSKNRFNCCHPPIFPFILIEQVVIDSLHLFLRISDVLINLLIRDLRILDGTEKATSLDEANKTNIKAYKTFLNESCKIRFQWYFEKEAKKLVTWPVPKRDISTRFPALPQNQKIQKLWEDFFRLIRSLSKSECNADDFEKTPKNGFSCSLQFIRAKILPLTSMHLHNMHTSSYDCMETLLSLISKVLRSSTI